MKDFSKELPTEKGYYWLHKLELKTCEIVEINISDNTFNCLEIWYFGNEEGCLLLQKYYENCEWKKIEIPRD